MELEKRTEPTYGGDITLPHSAHSAHSDRRRVRTGQRLLHREAVRRRHRANALVVVSLAAVMGLVGVFYSLLSR